MIESTEKFWEAVYRRNIGKMIGICYRYTSNQQLSEDLAHDALVKAIDKFDSFKGKGHFDAWLRRIVVNHVLQHIRNQKKQISIDDWEHLDSREQSEDTYSNAHSIKQVTFSEKELLETIDQLPEHHKLVFNLYVMEKFTHVQIGEELGISSGTSKSHLARARKKLKQLLAQKGENKQNERNKKKMFLLLLFPIRFKDIDRLYQKQFNQFEIPSNRELPVESAGFRNVPESLVKPYNATFWHFTIGGTSVLIISTVLFFALNSDKKKESNTTPTASIPGLDKQEWPPNEEVLKTPESHKDSGEKSILSDSSTATIFRDSVILGENIKKTSMKSLDSAAAMFLVSTSILFDSVAQPDYQPHRTGNNHSEQLIEKIEPMKLDQVIDTDKPIVRNKKESGTFYASKLFWSKESKTVSFTGKVKVNFEENNFSGTGTYKFLGPVHLLIFNDKPATLDTNIKLSKSPYQLTRIDSKEATKKYGEEGQQGAIEISVIE